MIDHLTPTNQLIMKLTNQAALLRSQLDFVYAQKVQGELKAKKLVAAAAVAGLIIGITITKILGLKYGC